MEGRAPLVFEDVQADATQLVNVWVVDPGDEPYLHNVMYEINMQWDHKEILGSIPWVPDCYNGKIQSFFAESIPFPDHFFKFSGLLAVIFIQIVKKGYKM